MKSYFGNIMLPSCYIMNTVYTTFRLGKIGNINIQLVIVMVNFKYFMKAVKNSIHFFILHDEESHGHQTASSSNVIIHIWFES